MREIFAIGWGNPDVREQWKSAAPADRGALLEQANSRPTNRIRNARTPPARPTGRSGTAPPRTSAGCMRGCSTTRWVRRRRCAIMSEVAGIDRPQRVALHRRQSRKPARRPDVQLVCGGPHRPAVGGQFPTELAALPQPERRRLGDDDHQAGLRDAAALPLNVSTVPTSVRASPRSANSQVRDQRLYGTAHLLGANRPRTDRVLNRTGNVMSSTASSPALHVGRVRWLGGCFGVWEQRSGGCRLLRAPTRVTGRHRHHRHPTDRDVPVPRVATRPPPPRANRRRSGLPQRYRTVMRGLHGRPRVRRGTIAAGGN